MKVQCPFCKLNYELLPNEKVQRTNRQNRAYFGLAVQELARQSNCDLETMHKALAGEFIGWEEIKIGNKILKVPKSTRKLNTKQFSEFFEKVQRWAAENGIDIKNPNE